MCSISVHYIIQKPWKHQRRHKEFFVNYNTLLHVSALLGHLQGETFRCRYTWLHYTVNRECAGDYELQCNGRFLPEDDPAGPIHVGVCYNCRKNSLCIRWCFKVFCYLLVFVMFMPCFFWKVGTGKHCMSYLLVLIFRVRYANQNLWIHLRPTFRQKFTVDAVSQNRILKPWIMGSLGQVDSSVVCRGMGWICCVSCYAITRKVCERNRLHRSARTVYNRVHRK
jgi:hypothetical protein